MSLIKTNKYLRDPVLREYYNLQSAISNFGVEGIKPTKEQLERLKELKKSI